eukprot:5866181-Ditylum_brightwellii.AAC.1
MVEVAPAPCCCLHIEKKNLRSVDGPTEEYKIDLTLQPIEIMYRESTVNNLSYMAKSLSTSEEVPDIANANIEQNAPNRPVCKESKSPAKINLSVSLPNITLLLPFDDDPVSSMKRDSLQLNYDLLFDRCSYAIPDGVCVQKASLGLTLDDIFIEISNIGGLLSDIGDSNDIDENGFNASLICKYAIIFAESPIIEERGNGGVKNQ